MADLSFNEMAFLDRREEANDREKDDNLTKQIFRHRNKKEIDQDEDLFASVRRRATPGLRSLGRQPSDIQRAPSNKGSIGNNTLNRGDGIGGYVSGPYGEKPSRETTYLSWSPSIRQETPGVPQANPVTSGAETPGPIKKAMMDTGVFKHTGIQSKHEGYKYGSAMQAVNTHEPGSMLTENVHTPKAQYQPMYEDKGIMVSPWPHDALKTQPSCALPSQMIHPEEEISAPLQPPEHDMGVTELITAGESQNEQQRDLAAYEACSDVRREACEPRGSPTGAANAVPDQAPNGCHEVNQSFVSRCELNHGQHLSESPRSHFHDSTGLSHFEFQENVPRVQPFPYNKATSQFETPQSCQRDSQDARMEGTPRAEHLPDIGHASRRTVSAWGQWPRLASLGPQQCSDQNLHRDHRTREFETTNEQPQGHGHEETLLQYINRIELEAAIKEKETGGDLYEIADEIDSRHYHHESIPNISDVAPSGGEMPFRNRIRGFEPPGTELGLAQQRFSHERPSSRLTGSRRDTGLFDNLSKYRDTSGNLDGELEMTSFWRPNVYM